MPRGTRVIVATSGGPDSMALLDVLARHARAFDLDLFACGVDHRLRKEAASELDLAEAHAEKLGIPFERSAVAVASGTNLQDRARTARWKALVAEARRRKARAIATAHHADDRAETFLLRLLRGAGSRGLGVLPPRDGATASKTVEAIRPLLRARRSDVLLHLGRHAIPFARDPSNEDPRFSRARVRRDVLPLLEALDPSIVVHLGRLADELSSSRDGRARLPQWTLGLPRPTQEAIASMIAKKSEKARIWMPGGLVVALRGKKGEEK